MKPAGCRVRARIRRNGRLRVRMRREILRINATRRSFQVRARRIGNPWTELFELCFVSDAQVWAASKTMRVIWRRQGDPWRALDLDPWKGRAPELLAAMRAQGADLWVERDVIRTRGLDRMHPDLMLAMRGHVAELRLLLAAERARAVEARVGQLVAAIPANTIRTPSGFTFVGAICLVPGGVPERWGRCMCCGDPMEPHMAGQCGLCNEALPKATALANRGAA